MLRDLTKDLSLTNVGGFRAFVGGNDVELYRVVFRKALKTIALNRGEMHEDIRGTIFRRDEAKSFGVIEPLHFSFCAHCNVYLYSFKIPGVLGALLCEVWAP